MFGTQQLKPTKQAGEEKTKLPVFLPSLSSRPFQMDENDDAEQSNSDQNSASDSDSDVDSGNTSENENDEASSQKHMDDEQNSESEDSDNPHVGSEPEDFTVQAVLNWICNTQDTGEDAEYVDYPDLDCQEIVDRMQADDLCTVIEELLEKELSDENDSYFETIKELIQLSGDDLDIDHDLLTRNLVRAIKEDNTKKVKFFIAQGAHQETGIPVAINQDSVDMLELLEADVDDDYIKAAASGNYLDAVGYFLQKDFVASVDVILDILVAESNPELLRVVCEHAEVDQIYDVIKYLVQIDGELFIAEIFKYMDVVEVLQTVHEQDRYRSFYSFVFEHAKKYLSTSELEEEQIQKILAEFEKKLHIANHFLVFPQKFSGDKRLNKIRQSLDHRKFDDEKRLAANFIGVPLSPFNRYLTDSPYHAFETKKAETYFRSAKDHPLTVHVGGENSQYKSICPPEKEADSKYGGSAHLGLIKHPQDNLCNFHGADLSKKNKIKTFNAGDGAQYDRLLRYKHRICDRIVMQFNGIKQQAIKVGFYHHYPCVMVALVKPFIAKAVNPGALNAWTEIVISYFVGLVNHLAVQAGLNIELVRRSSFGFLRPTIAPCDFSIRINVGMVPLEYADLLAQALTLLNQTLLLLNQSTSDLKKKKLNIQLPKDCFLTTQAYKDYKGKDKLPTADNVLALVWEKVEKGGKTAAYNLARTPLARDALAAVTFNALQQVKKPNTLQDCAAIFLDMLRWGISQLGVNKKTFQFNPTVAVQFIFKSRLKLVATINDAEFFKVIADLLVKIKHEIQTKKLTDIAPYETETIVAIEVCLAQKSVQDIYYHLEMINELLYSRAILTCAGREEDDFGSSSDEEGGALQQGQHFHAKKLTVQNGMRAILAALHAGAAHLFPDYATCKPQRSLFLYGAYYETADALKLLAKFNVKKNIADIGTAQVLIYDINACVKNATAFPVLTPDKLSGIKVLIIDSTSATVEQYHHWIRQFQQQAKMEILFFVSSGFKNEQMGADGNPYGTVRIFVKNASLLKKVMDFIKKNELPIRSSISHTYRRVMKTLGHVPRNKVIIHFAPEKKSSSSATTASSSSMVTVAGLYQSSFASRSPSGGSNFWEDGQIKSDKELKK